MALTFSLFLLLSTLPALGLGDSQQNWARFRGPNGSGVQDSVGLPVELREAKNLRWRKEVAAGHSSPVLLGPNLYLTGLEREELVTLALDRKSGEVRWRSVAPRARSTSVDARNHPASPTPAADQDGVVVFFPDFGLLAYDDQGHERWRVPLGPFRNLYGMGASPILVDDTVILACDQTTDSYLLAVDRHSGKVRWKTPRSEARTGHCTPIEYRPADAPVQVILPGSFLLDSYAVATGEKVWWSRGLCFEMKATPVLHEGVVYINGFGSPLNQPGQQVEVEPFPQVLESHDADQNGVLTREEMPKSKASAWFDFVDLEADGALDAADWRYLRAALASQNGMLALRAGGEGDVTDTALVWKYQRSVPQLPSPLIYRDVLYMLHDNGGILVTFRPATGEVLARGRVPDAVDSYFASPVAGDGKVYLVSLAGLIIVLPADGTLEPLARHDLAEPCHATPALADGRLFVRSGVALYCFGNPE